MGVAEWVVLGALLALLVPFTLLLRSALGQIQWLREEVVALKIRAESAKKDRNHIRDSAHRDRAAFLVSHRELLRVFEQRVSNDEDGYMVPAEPEDGVEDREPAEPEDMMRLAQAADPSRDIHQLVANQIMQLGRREGLSGRSNAMSRAFAMNYGSSVQRAGVDARAPRRSVPADRGTPSTDVLPPGFYRVSELIRIPGPNDSGTNIEPGLILLSPPRTRLQNRRWVDFSTLRDRLSLSAHGQWYLLEALHVGALEHLPEDVLADTQEAINNAAGPGAQAMVPELRNFGLSVQQFAQAMGRLPCRQAKPPEPRTRLDRLLGDDDG